MSPTQLDLRRLAAIFRLLAWLALLVAGISTFHQPFGRVLGYYLGPALGAERSLGLAAAPGFMLQITSRPSGAKVLLDGVERGTTPALLNVVCRQGDEVVIAVELDRRVAERRVLCREGGRLQADLPLPTDSSIGNNVP